MTEAGGPERDDRKLLAGAAIKIRIAVVSALVLTVGAWLAPRAAQPALMAPQEHAAPLLEEQVQQRQATRPFVGVQDVAATAHAFTVAIPLPSPGSTLSRNDFTELGPDPFAVAGYGAVVSDRYVLTHLGALAGRSSVELSGRDVAPMAQVVAYDAPSGLVLLQTEPSDRTAAPVATDRLPAGSLVVGVGRSAQSEIALPVFITAVSEGRYAIGTANGSILPGMPIFTLAGELFAIAAPLGAEVRAIPVREVMDRLMARAATGERQSSFGIAIQMLSGGAVPAFGDEGAVVTRVVEGGPADLADIRVGDVLLEIGESPVASLEAATAALRSAALGMATRWRVRRGRRTLDVDVTPALAYEVAALARTSDAVPAGSEARVALPPAVREAAAIPPAARVVSVNGRAVASRTDVERELSRGRGAASVLVQHGQDWFFVPVEPGR